MSSCRLNITIITIWKLSRKSKRMNRTMDYYDICMTVTFEEQPVHNNKLMERGILCHCEMWIENVGTRFIVQGKIQAHSSIIRGFQRQAYECPSTTIVTTTAAGPYRRLRGKVPTGVGFHDNCINFRLTGNIGTTVIANTCRFQYYNVDSM